MPVPIETERLMLRHFELCDLEDLYLQLSSPEVMRYYPSPLSREEAEKWLQGILRDYETNGYGMYVIVLKDTGSYVGQAGVVRREPEGQVTYYLSYILCSEFWGCGYASEAVRAVLDHAFADLGVLEVTALIDVENEPSIRLAKKVGMQFVSTKQHMGKEHHVCSLTRP